VIRVVLFDIDGTLVRTGGAGVRAFERTFASQFNAPDATRHVQFAGRTDPSLVRECLGKRQIEPGPAEFDRFFQTYVFWLQHLLTEAEGSPCPGTRDLIEGLQRLPNPPLLGLLTGNIRLGAEIKLRHYDLWGMFETGAFGDDHEDRNQLAAIARDRASDYLGKRVSGDEVLVIGDTPLDIRCAEAIQAKSLAVATGGATHEHLAAHRPTVLLRDLTEITPEQLCAT
jgi:phosphoglycolate phosphatase